MAATPSVEDDFDAWFNEDVTLYRFKLLGRTWELPGAAPAATVLRYQKLMDYIVQADLPEGAEVTEADLPDGMTADDLSFNAVLNEFAGQEMVAKWMELGLTDEHIPRIAQRLVDRYVLGNKGGEASGKAPKQPQDRRPAKKTTARRPRKSSAASSSTGPASKPPGKRSTTATSTTT
jgi:hypothetical protein